MTDAFDVLDMTYPAFDRGGALLGITRREDLDVSDPVTDGGGDGRTGDRMRARLTASDSSGIPS